MVYFQSIVRGKSHRVHLGTACSGGICITSPKYVLDLTPSTKHSLLSCSATSQSTKICFRHEQKQGVDTKQVLPFSPYLVSPLPIPERLHLGAAAAIRTHTPCRANGSCSTHSTACQGCHSPHSCAISCGCNDQAQTVQTTCVKACSNMRVTLWARSSCWLQHTLVSRSLQ